MIRCFNLPRMSTGVSQPLISVCIPAYKHAEFLKRLLDSLTIQRYDQFEVIITDDSPDDSVYQLVQRYADRLTLHYYKNMPALGTPGNWNAAIKKASGKWIKLIHDDDWFSSAESLQQFVTAIKHHPDADFIFSAFNNVRVDRNGDSSTNIDQQGEIVRAEKFRLTQLQKNPVTLLSKNIIGPPSVVIHKNDQQIFYDTGLKWLVDMDFYIRYLKNHRSVYLDEALVNIGLNTLQVTNSSSLVREVEIPEHFAVLEKTGVQHLENLLVYDAWWRLFRNLGIRNTVEIEASGYKGRVPPCLVNMLSFQSRIPRALLRVGPLSKLMMMSSYTHNMISGGFS